MYSVRFPSVDAPHLTQILNQARLTGANTELSVLQASSADSHQRVQAAEARVKELEEAAQQAQEARSGTDQQVEMLQEAVATLTKETETHLASLTQTKERLAQAYSEIEANKLKEADHAECGGKLAAAEAVGEAAEARAVTAEKALADAIEKHAQDLEAVMQQEALERAKALQQLMHSQVHVVVSAPCIKLVINHSKEQVYLPPPEEVAKKVKALLENDVLPKYLAVIASAPEAASQVAEDRMQKFCSDVSTGINDQISSIVMEGGASAGVIQRG